MSPSLTINIASVSEDHIYIVHLKASERLLGPFDNTKTKKSADVQLKIISEDSLFARQPTIVRPSP